MGDFNAVMDPDNHSGGDMRWFGHHDNFPKACYQAQLTALLYTESYFKQKSRVQWLQLGDKNTFFHKTVLHRQTRNRITSLTNEEGTTFIDHQAIGNMTASYFEKTLNHGFLNATENLSHLFPNHISAATSLQQCSEVTDNEIKEAFFSIPDGKALGPDEFTVWFFKHSWSTIGKDFIVVVLHFFSTGSPTGKFTIHSTWETLREKRPISASHRFLWFNGHILRHSFILWLAMQRRLSIKDSLWFLEDSPTCNLCGSIMESHDHLFFQCQYSSLVWSSISNIVGIKRPNIHWSDLLLWTTNNLSAKKDMEHMIGHIILSVVVYHIWYERNSRLFNNLSKSVTSLLDDITQLVRLHLSSIKLTHPLPTDVISQWGISPLTDRE
ncbi:hypothetical protein SADUNF_Sadunf16G0264700 [Salix dunnii]|uniref:Reverse transcriptase zinc-binding domain-containing protein n=1 Tax=Salix dunnii TaxID=1413687 RepID=A0A835MI50_9ROSI|nr:hypothetical protein SADUNF_Sadunf16G0264700 [Salix dunnii]